MPESPRVRRRQRPSAVSVTTPNAGWLTGPERVREPTLASQLVQPWVPDADTWAAAFAAVSAAHQFHLDTTGKRWKASYSCHHWEAAWPRPAGPRAAKQDWHEHCQLQARAEARRLAGITRERTRRRG